MLIALTACLRLEDVLETISRGSSLGDGNVAWRRAPKSGTEIVLSYNGYLSEQAASERNQVGIVESSWLLNKNIVAYAQRRARLEGSLMRGGYIESRLYIVPDYSSLVVSILARLRRKGTLSHLIHLLMCRVDTMTIRYLLVIAFYHLS